MKKLPAYIVLVFVLLATSSLFAQKRPLEIDDIESWNKITERVISPDGRWIAYKTQPARGDSRVHVHAKSGERRFELECGKVIEITDDSKFVVFTIEPRHERLRDLKRRQTRREDMPGNALGVYSIESRSLETIEDIGNYKLPRQWAGWLAYQVDAREIKDGTAEGQQKSAKRESARNGFALNLRNLESRRVVSWPFVTDYGFVEREKRLFFVSTGDDKDFDAGLYVYDIEKERLISVMTGKNEYRRIAVSNQGDRLAFLVKPIDGEESADYGVYFWNGEGQAERVVGNGDEGIPANWRISENGAVSFSGNGRRVFFGTAPVRPRRDAAILDDEYPDVDVWHFNEGLLQSVQIVNRDRELRRTYLAMYDFADGRLVQIETKDVPRATLLDRGNADRVLLHSSKPYELQSMWNPLLHDAYLLDLVTGEMQTVVLGSRDSVRPSPGGKYLAWFDYSDYSYYTYRVDSGEKYRVTEPSVVRADDESNTTFNYNAPYGSPGWLKDDESLLVYDRYDIWKVDPENARAPENLTLSGRRDTTVYRLVRLTGAEGVFDDKEPQYLLGVNEVSRASGYYRCVLGEPSEPELLLGGEYRLSTPLKAKNADTVVYTKETFNVFPDLLVSDLGFENSVRVSDANPQQSQFLWGTAELYRWTSLDGRPLEGILYKPEGFDPTRRYPMIVQFFHKSSDQLFNHRAPEYSRSRIDYQYFISNGYIVFNPDIYFDPGYIGESAYKSIMPGVTALIDEGFVDPARIGAQGHSYSGYQAAYLATRTNLFACIEAGAPVVNFFSAYGGIRWESGRSRAAQYEQDQTLATPWEAPLRFLENSPIFAMDKVTTPILILHNDQDGAVPWYQGIEYFISLRRLQKPAWLLNYNGEGHGIGKFKNRKDFQTRLSQFFGHYLKGSPMPEWMRDGIPAVDKGHNLGYEVKP